MGGSCLLWTLEDRSELRKYVQKPEDLTEGATVELQLGHLPHLSVSTHLNFYSVITLLYIGYVILYGYATSIINTGCSYVLEQGEVL